MAKRFTDTVKWKDVWFQGLPMKYKLFWLYLLDECDNSGVWKPNIGLAQFQIGEAFEDIELRRVFAGRVVFLESGYWFIQKFIDFQYGELSPASKPHASVLGLLQKHGIKGYTKGIQTLKEKDKDKEEAKDKEGVKVITDPKAFAKIFNKPYPKERGMNGAGQDIDMILAQLDPAIDWSVHARALRQVYEAEGWSLPTNPATIVNSLIGTDWIERMKDANPERKAERKANGNITATDLPPIAPANRPGALDI